MTILLIALETVKLLHSLIMQIIYSNVSNVITAMATTAFYVSLRSFEYQLKTTVRIAFDQLNKGFNNE